MTGAGEDLPVSFQIVLHEAGDWNVAFEVLNYEIQDI